VQEQLQQIGIPYQTGIADTGVVALIEGKNPSSKTLALRADMDALPIIEANEVPYKSKQDGVMHACGHDVHTASLLGVAKILHGIKDSIEGRVKLIFQPAEERLPGGASLMIKEGVLEKPAPASILGQHVYPQLEVGKVGFRGGMMMASADELHITVYGKGGHGALPHLGIDTVLIAANIITALQQVISRRANPLVPCVLHFGDVSTNSGTFNVIPNEVYIKGTFRTMDENWRAQAHEIMKTMAEGIAKSMGGSCDFGILVGYPHLKNDEALTQRCKTQAISYLGKSQVVDIPMRMTAEDFAYYTHEVPGCFYRLGVANTARGINSPVHTPTFDIDEAALEIGMGLMAWLGVQELATMRAS
jgi:amidohydrolase